MSYTVHEIFLTVQGEGHNMGRVAVFCRFAGCNLWSGLEQDRATATCQFCDTEFRGGTRHDLASLIAEITALWPANTADRLIVLTGGEPLLQVDAPLTAALAAEGFTIAVETNGTQKIPPGIDWLCVSPKANAPLAINHADELKLVFPQPALMPDQLTHFQSPLRWLSPMDGPDIAANTQAAATYCLAHPSWRLAIQAHKTWGLR